MSRALWATAFLATAAVISMHAAARAADIPAAGPARLYPETELVSGGKPACTIVRSSSDEEFAEAATRLAGVLSDRYSMEFACVLDSEVCPRRIAPISDEFRHVNLIVVGNLDNNRAVVPFYAGFACGADSHYPGGAVGAGSDRSRSPGGDGYELRTICNPWGTGRNCIIVGASSAAGASAGVETLAGKLPELHEGAARLPLLLEVQVGEELRATFESSARSAAAFRFEPFAARDHVAMRFARPALEYHWTGNPRWAEAARQVMSFFNEVYEGAYPVSDYEMETWFLAWDLVEEAPVFSEEERQLTIARLVETAFKRRNYGAVRADQASSRHTSQGSMAVWEALRYLQKTFPDGEELQEALAEWEEVLKAYFANVATGFRDDRDCTESIDSITCFLRWCMMEQQTEYFESGHARQALQYAVTYYDSLGYTCGIDGYAEAVPGNIRLRFGLAYPLRLAAFAYNDPGMRWLNQNFAAGQRMYMWYVPLLFGASCYQPPPDAKANRPRYLLGLSGLPLTQRRYEMVEQGLGRLTPGVGTAMPPWDETIDKLCFRSGFETKDQYLLLQGFQGALVGTVDANSIPRYTERGEVWLFQHTDRIGHYHRNAIFVSNGLNEGELQAACRLDAAGRFDDFAMTSTTLPDYHGTDWQRAVFWQRGRWFVVMDRVRVNDPGLYSAQCIWRTPIHGTWTDDRRFTTTPGEASFHVLSSHPVAASCQAEPPDGAARPFVLRQRKSGEMKAGEVLDFQNLLRVTDAGRRPDFQPVRLSDSAVVVRSEDGEPVLLGVGGEGLGALGIEADSGLYAISPSRLLVAGVRRLALDGEAAIDAEEPVTCQVSLQDGQIRPGHDGAQIKTASLTWELPRLARTAPLAAARAQRLARVAAERLKQVAEPAGGMAVAEQSQARSALEVQWESDQIGYKGSPVPGLRVRAMTPVEDPIRDAVSQAIDGMIPMGRAGPMWAAGQPASFELAWDGPQAIEEIRAHVGQIAPVRRPDLAEPVKAQREVEVTWSSDGFERDLRTRRIAADLSVLLTNPNKGYVYPHGYLRLKAGAERASAARVTIPAAGENAKTSLTEVEVLTAERGPVETHHLQVRDLEEDGTPEIIVSTGEGLLSVVEADGGLRWQHEFTGRVSGLAVADINGDGRREIVCGSYGTHVYAFSCDGEMLWKTSFIGVREKTHSKHLVNGEVPLAVGLWEPEAGVRRIIVGGYYDLAVLDEQGEVLQHYQCGGAHSRVVLEDGFDVDGDGQREAFMSYSIPWQGRGGVFTLKAGDALSHTRTSIPNGTPYLAELVEGATAAIGTPEGFGLYDLAGNKVVWEHAGGRPLSAGTLHDTDGDGARELLIGGRDGFVSMFSAQGDALASHLIGEPVNDLAVVGAAEQSVYLVATDSGLLAYDADWEKLGEQTGAYARVTPLGTGDAALVAVTTDARLQVCHLAD